MTSYAHVYAYSFNTTPPYPYNHSLLMTRAVGWIE